MSTAGEVWTIERILKVTADYFAGKGIASSRLDAELLLVHVLKVPRISLYTNFDRPLSDSERDSYRALVKRRGAYEPVAYILGEREFYGRKFGVSPDVLIPRPETEHLVDAVLERVRQSGIAAPRIIDVGTGSGAIAVTLAAELREAKVTAVDISAKALAVARSNAAFLGVNVDFREADLVKGIEPGFDIVVANLPYIGESERAQLTPDVRDHEPAVALFAGADGLDAIRRLVVDAVRLYDGRGLIALEIGAGQSTAVQQLLQAAGWQSVAALADLAGHLRVVMGERR